MRARCRQFEQAVGPAWDRFVLEQQEGTFFHFSGWRQVIEHSFGHQAHYLYTERDGAITGVLPLVHVKTFLFGNRLVSNPFCVYGGPLAVDRESASILEEGAIDLMKRLGAATVEFRYRGSVETDWADRPPLYVTFRKKICADADGNMEAIPRKQRAMVRKAIRNGLGAETSTTDIAQLHRVYAESVHNLGTPVFSRRYFETLMTCFSGACDVLTISDDGNAVAAVMNFYFRDEVLPYYGGGTSAARASAANDFMYWEVMRRAGERGYRLFDFGRSKIGTGSFRFKKNWGFEAEPLNYRYRMAPKATIPDFNPMSPKYRALVAGWKRLPLCVANVLGPTLVRGLG